MYHFSGFLPVDCNFDFLGFIELQYLSSTIRKCKPRRQPILLHLIHAKAEQENLSNSQEIELKKYVDETIRQFTQEVMMDKKLFKELESNLKQAVSGAKGESLPQSVYVALSPADIKAIRAEVGMSQAVFARSFQLSLETVKGWEQGKRKPDAAAANFLRIIQADPAFVQKALAA